MDSRDLGLFEEYWIHRERSEPEDERFPKLHPRRNWKHGRVVEITDSSIAVLVPPTNQRKPSHNSMARPWGNRKVSSSVGTDGARMGSSVGDSRNGHGQLNRRMSHSATAPEPPTLSGDEGTCGDSEEGGKTPMGEQEAQPGARSKRTDRIEAEGTIDEDSSEKRWPDAEGEQNNGMKLAADPLQETADVEDGSIRDLGHDRSPTGLALGGDKAPASPRRASSTSAQSERAHRRPSESARRRSSLVEILATSFMETFKGSPDGNASPLRSVPINDTHVALSASATERLARKGAAGALPSDGSVHWLPFTPTTTTTTDELLVKARANLRCIEWEKFTLELVSTSSGGLLQDLANGSVGQSPYELSRPVQEGERVDFFLSHSWYVATRRRR